MRKMLILLAMLVVVSLWSGLGWAQNCTTTRNPFSGQVETRCTDGSTSTTTRNPFSGHLDTVIRPAPAPYGSPYGLPREQRCTTSRNPFSGAIETRCQ